MLRKLLLWIAILGCLKTFSQSSEMTEEKYDKYLKYLHDKLSYTYYNEHMDKWWINKFDETSEAGELYIKNTGTKDPRLLKGKTYIEKRFRLSDLNPYSIERVHLDHEEGRLVVGEEIILYTVKHKKLIRKVTDGRPGSSQSFIQISIPQAVEDQKHITDSIIMVLRELIHFKTDLRNLNDDKLNRNLILETISGDHIYENPNGVVKRFMKTKTENQVTFEDYQNRKKLNDGILGYDPDNNRYFETIENTDGNTETYYYTLGNGDQLILTDESGTRQIVITNKSLYYYLIDNRRTDVSTS